LEPIFLLRLGLLITTSNSSYDAIDQADIEFEKQTRPIADKDDSTLLSALPALLLQLSALSRQLSATAGADYGQARQRVLQV